MQPQKGKVLENVEVFDAGSKGKHIARAGSFIVLVENAVPGDIVDVQVLRKKKGFAEGKAVRWHTYSADRRMPFCPHFTNCGGCSWQDMDYSSQLHFKQKMVTDSLQRIGKLELPDINPILGSSKIAYYRNRLDFAFSSKRWLTSEEMNTVREFPAPGLGFHISGRFDKVLDIQRCYLQGEPSNTIRLAVRQWALSNHYSFFDVREQQGSLRSLIVRTTMKGETMVIVIFHTESDERIRQMMDFLLTRFPFITSLYYVINAKANDTVFDLIHHLYHGRAYLIEEIDGITYRIGPKSFFQTNPFQAVQLFRIAKEFAGLTGEERVYDLYTGVGSIALLLAGNAKEVVGIESVEEAIEFAKANAADNRITNTKFFSGDVNAVLNQEFITKHGLPEVVVTDPPRTGMEPEVVKKILELGPGRIVYVSCNPATQARDLEMMKGDYQISRVQPVDMFPQTYHVENIVLLERRVN